MLYNEVKTQLSVALIGSGNLAYSLAHAISKSTNTLVEITSTNAANAIIIAQSTGAKFVEKVSALSANIDLYIIAVPDSAISSVAEQIPLSSGLVVHTSGSTPFSAISKVPSDLRGVFYPFQTFTFGREVDFNGIPLCIESESSETLDILRAFALSLGASPVEMDSDTRKWLHLSGVFACNFVNHILSLSNLIADENEIEFSLLKPLIAETVKKALEGNPFDCQTGPALRGDSETLKRHYAMLSQVDEELRDLYISLSTSIERLHKEM